MYADLMATSVVFCVSVELSVQVVVTPLYALIASLVVVLLMIDKGRVVVLLVLAADKGLVVVNRACGSIFVVANRACDCSIALYMLPWWLQLEQW